ncbi:MAG: hypothetical protein RL728_827 [Bacteroidota bacterium]|jgi:hypothetical protein
MMTTEEKKKKPRFKAGVDLSAKVNLTQSTDNENSMINRIWLFVKSKFFYQKSQD